jgi:hypothetical protein
MALPFVGFGLRNVSLGLPAVSIGLKLGEDWRAPEGYVAWLSTWLVSQFTFPTTMFPLADGAYHALRMPAAAYAGFDDRAEAERLLAELQRYRGQEFPRDLDAGFAALAKARREEAPIRVLLLVPARRIVHMWATPYFSSGWPIQVDEATRERVRTQGALAAALANPLPALVKGGGAVYRSALLALAVFLFVLAMRRGSKDCQMLLAAALVFAVVRTLVFARYGLVETRYLVTNIVWLEGAVAWSVCRLWPVLRLRPRSG